MSLNCKVQIVINNIPKKMSDMIKTVLEPDNVNFPENLTLEIQNIDNKLVLNFKSEDNMKSLISTIDEVLEHIQISLKVIE
jgi:tRNA threonylcarbamoyladenosine modification (KEOPS) complex  Pcc1 subunit